MFADLLQLEKMAADENYDLNENPFKPRHYLPSEQFSFTAVEREEVESIIMSMAPNKAPGNDKVPIHVIKTCLTVISPTITSIINASLLTSSFPSVWKNAEVVPIHKSGDHEIANNNRPISLLPVLSKICERAAYNQFSTYLLLNDRLSSKQSGNKHLHSTETSVIQTTDMILNAIDKKQLTAIVLLDMSKAFDSIDTATLITKLEDVGASCQAIQWFQSYLTSRYQVVRIQTTLSEPLEVKSGVPQGSILGPLLFSIYVNDLPSVPQQCSPYSYVDDTKLLMSFSLQHQQRAVSEINQDLLKIRNWCFDNKLLLNPEKTKAMICGSRQMRAKLPNFRLSLLGKEIIPVTSAKDLGVILDSGLTFDSHIQATISSCMSRLGQINRVKHCFDKHTLTIIINSLVFSKLYYCSTVWSNTSQTNLNNVQVVQNFACRIVSGVGKYDHVTPILQELKWLPVRQYLYFRDAVMAFKCMTGNAPAYLTEQFVRRGDISSRVTRNSSMIDTPLYRTATGQQSFKFRMATIWNSLKPELRACETTKDFKNILKQRLVETFRTNLKKS